MKVEVILTKVNLKEPVQITCSNRLRKWAYENAYMLFFMSFLFAITWIAIVYVGVKQSV